MNKYKISTRFLFSLVLFMAFAVSQVFAQTLTIHDFVTGIYTPGSSIGVPFTINSNTANCIQQNNQFNLYLADPSGTIISPVIGSFSGFYGTFVNGKIPPGTAPGTYTLVIKATNPVIVSTTSPVFTVGPGAAVTAGITGASISNSFPEVFGTCNGQPGIPYYFNDVSSTNASVVTFYNESTQLPEGAPLILTGNSNSTFTPQLTNYTIMVTATNAGTIGTRAYTLINNVLNNTFGVSGGSTVCLASSGGGMLTYNVDIQGPNGIQYNFPGTTYQVNWGDGLSTTYTLCDIQNLGGKIVHTYTTGSCGHTVNSHNNSFEVDIQPQSPYCPAGSVSAVTSYAKVLVAPTNGISPVKSGCTGTAVTFTNRSDPGDDPSSNLTTCAKNPNARYNWYVDGAIAKPNQPLGASFTYTFTHGVHYVTLELQAGTTGPCTAAPVTDTLCVQDPPQPAFSIPSPACLTSPVIPIDASILDLTCTNASAYGYLWTVTGPAGMTYAGGTNATSHQPQFKFLQPGIYQVTLSIITTGCGTITSAAQTLLVDASPVVSLSPSTAVCGTNKTYTFGPGGGITQTTITGTAQAIASTYSWTVTGGTGYSFVNGTTANSQYPQITFTDFNAYTISVTVQNSCGSLTKSQTLTFQNAPAVTVTPSAAIICPGSTVTLTGVISSSYTSFQWIGSGTFSAPGSLTSDYTPTAAEIAAGITTVGLDVNTGLTGSCAHILQNVTVNIYPVNNVISASTVQVCAGNAANYNIISTVSGSTFSWTAALTSGTATGFANGNGATISDVLVNNGPGDAVVTYTITPQANGCTGNPFVLKVTVKPQTAVTASPANNTICSGSATGISLTPTIAGTTYTWTSTATVGITGNSQRNIPVATVIINDVLNNAATTAGSITYTITPLNNGCPGNPVTVTLTVLPLPVTSRPGSNDEVCNATAYTLNGNNPPSGIGLWTVIPAAGITFSDAAQPNATAIGLVPGTTYSFTWTITIPGCQSTAGSVTIKDDLPAVGGTTAGANTFCAGNNNGAVTLSGQTGNIIRWESSTDNGTTWKIINNTGTSQLYLNLTQTTQYRALVQNGVCAPVYSSVTIITIIQPVTTANAGPNDEVCSATTYTLQGNTPTSGTGKWTLASGQTGITFSDDTLPNATAIGLIPGNTYQFTWAISSGGPCSLSSASVTIKDDLLAVGGNTTGNATVCSGSNGGAITLSGQTGSIIRWESSTDNGNTWNVITNTTTSISYSNLTQTTQYRAVVQSGVCPIVQSGVTTIQVNPPAPVANAGPSQNICNQTSATLAGNNPGAFPGVWHQTAGPQVIFADSTNYQTTVSGLSGGNSYTFTWTIRALAPCATTQSPVTINDSNDAVAGFTIAPKSSCGNLTAQFTNTSTNQAGAAFLWAFGDGSAQSNAVNPLHTFAQRTDGRDTTYIISLSIPGNCVQRAPVIDSVLVRPAIPVARILPNTLNGCGNFALDVQNISPGKNVSYDFYLYDGAVLVQKITKTDKSDAIFNPISTTSRKTFTLYMIATGYCNNTGESVHIPVSISPISIVAQMFVQNNINKGCVPLNVTFINNSSGGDTFAYIIYDSNNNIVDQFAAGTAPVPYTFNTIGTYYVAIAATNPCGTTVSNPRTRIDVYTAPKPDFTADITGGCKDIPVKFTNNTVSNDPNIPASSLSYDWDFGDGSPHSFAYTPPPHNYHYVNSPFTVTLTAVNTTTTCSSTIVKQSYIALTGPPETAFIEKPDSTISIPNYTFSFIDQTVGSPVSWKWTFSDGQSSTKQNPIITFPDTGLYKATLTTANAMGCDSTLTRNVRITGVPGQLYVPNAFVPTSLTGSLKIFIVKGSGIKTWLFQIFNNFGELVWQTTKLDSKGAPVEGWDGTFKGIPAPQGMYVWQASATFINGTEWKGMSYNNSLPKRIGSVYLIR